jgi:hypothetical protein
MDSLKDLIQLITRKRVKKIELFDETHRQKASNYFKLFNGIQQQKYLSDEDAARDIYDCLPSEKKYLILKTRLRQKLLNTLFFLHFEDNTASALDAAFECNRNLYLAKILLLNESFSLAVPLLEKTLKKAQQFSLTEIVWECARLLRSHHSRKQAYREFELYSELTDRTRKIMLAEETAQKYYEEMLTPTARAAYQKLPETAGEYIRAVQADFEQYLTPRLALYFFRMRCLAYRYLPDYLSLLLVLDELETTHAEHFSVFSQTERQEFILLKSEAYLHLRHYASGVAHLGQMEVVMPVHTPAWMELQRYGFLLAMHTGNYKAAALVFKKVTESIGFRQVSEEQKGGWEVFQVYLHFIYKHLKIKEIRPSIQNARMPFQLSGFLSRTLPLDKERKDFHLALLLGQLLFFLKKNDTESMRKTVAEMQRYCRRFPKKDPYFRVESFVSMLGCMVEEDFRFYQTRKLTETTLEEIRKMPSEYQGGSRGLEILPYEQVWDIILEELKAFRYG